MAAQSEMFNDVQQMPTISPKRRSKFDGSSALLYALMLFLGLIFMFPFFWTVASSLKAVDELFLFPPTILPESPQWVNYATVLDAQPFLLWAFNSLFVVVLSTVGTVIASSIAAYSFARFRYRGREVLFVITLGTMMLPAEVTLIPQYVMFNKMGWINTLYPLWVPFWFGGNAFSIFLLRQFILSLPRELDEAALIDGASYMRIFWQILLPLCKPVLATVAIIRFIDSWNDFLGPLIYIQLPNKFTLSIGLNYFQNLAETGGEPTQHLLMAASVMMIAPVIVLFFFTQRYFVQGIVLSGIKG